MMMEYAREARKHIAVMEEEMSQADFLSTVFSHASWKDLDLVSRHTFPIELKLYAAIKPKTAQIMAEGTRAAGWSEKKATPLGKDKTPAPIILFAKLKVEEERVA